MKIAIQQRDTITKLTIADTLAIVAAADPREGSTALTSSPFGGCHCSIEASS